MADVNSHRKEILQSQVIQNSMPELIRRSRADWSRLGNAHILLTGGTGFFGSWILVSFAALRQEGFPIEMTVLSRDPDSFLAKNPMFQNLAGLSFRKGDVRDATIPFSITHVLHFATSGANPDSAEPEKEIRSTLVEGTRHMLSEAKRVGASRFLFASSGAVYGLGRSASGRDRSDRSREDEIDSNAALTPYGRAKREAEELCRQAAIARDVESVVMRAFTFCGPLFPVEGPYVVSSYMNSILNELPIQVKTPASIRSFLDGRDLVAAIWKILTDGKSGEAYNVGSDESVSAAELADIMRSIALKVSLRVPDVRVIGGTTGPSDIYRPSIEKLTRELGWRPAISLRESLRNQAEWALERL